MSWRWHRKCFSHSSLFFLCSTKDKRKAFHGFIFWLWVSFDPPGSLKCKYSSKAEPPRDSRSPWDPVHTEHPKCHQNLLWNVHTTPMLSGFWADPACVSESLPLSHFRLVLCSLSSSWSKNAWICTLFRFFFLWSYVNKVQALLIHQSSKYKFCLCYSPHNTEDKMLCSDLCYIF